MRSAWLPYDWTPRSEAYFVFPLALCARRVSSAASRLLGTTSLRFALHGWQRRLSCCARLICPDSCCARWISVSGRRNHLTHNPLIFLNWQNNSDISTPFFYHNWFFQGIEKVAEVPLCLRRGHSPHQIALDRITPYQIAQKSITYLRIYREVPYQVLNSLGGIRVVLKRIIGQVALGER
nr:hypothetical protein [Thiolapillus sp.]